MRVRVYKSTGSWYIVQNEQGSIFNARIKGKFKNDNITSTNPISVGDMVGVEFENEGGDIVTISEIEHRKNYITRQSPHNKNQRHIIASNLDQAVLFATLKNPKTSQGFIDRFLITSEAYHIPSIIVYNKTDLYKKKDLENLENLKDMYERIGYRVLGMSIELNEGIDELKMLLKDKITLLSGHSGVGKSSFINLIFPELKLRVQDVSDWSGKGLHTTTFAEMFNLPFGGQVIDTPGIRELGLIDITKQELSHYFPEMRALLSECQFNNCMHMNEPGCAIKDAVGTGIIHMDRYLSYCNLLDGIEEKKY